MKIISLVLFSLWFFISCSDEPRSGTATDTENTLSGIVLDSAGIPQEGVLVQIITDSLGLRYGGNTLLQRVGLGFVSSILMDSLASRTFTDARGFFEFPKIPPGVFDLYLSRETESEGAVGVRHLRGLELTNLETQKLDSIVLQRPSVLRGLISFQRNDVPLYEFGDHFRVGLLGTGRFLSVVDGREFVLTGLPPGPQTLVFYPADQYLTSRLVEAGMHQDSLMRRVVIDLPAGDTLSMSPLRYRIPLEYYWERVDTTVKRRLTLKGRVLGGNFPAVGAHVRIIQDFQGLSYSNSGQAPFPISDSTFAVTDSQGFFSLPAPSCSSGAFNVEILLFQGHDPVGVAMHYFLNPCRLDSIVHFLPDRYLSAPSSMRGRLTYSEDLDAQIPIGSHFKVGVQGTSRFVNVMAGEIFEIYGLMPGNMSLVFYPGDNFIREAYVRNGVLLSDMILELNNLQVAAATMLQLQGVDYTLPLSMRR